MAKITKIETDIEFGEEYSKFEGAIVHLDDGKNLSIGISTGQSCCELYGFVTAEEYHLPDFIGAELLSYDIVDKDLAVKSNKLLGEKIYDIPALDEGGIVFLNVHTSAGTLQFSVYNAHNGYYGHEATVRYGDQEIHNDGL